MKKLLGVAKIKVEPRERRDKRHKNVLDKELVLFLKPLDMNLSLFVCAKYDIKGQSVSTNSLRYRVLSIVWIALIVIFQINTLHVVTVKTHDIATFCAFIASIISRLMGPIGYIQNCYKNYKEKDNNVLLVVKIQKLQDALRIDSSIFKRFIFSNWVGFLLLNLYSLYYAIIYYFVLKKPWHYMSLYHIYVLFDTNILYASRLIRLLRQALTAWLNNKAEIFEKLENDNHWNKMFGVLVDIIEAFELVVTLFQQFVSTLELIILLIKF